MRKGKSQIGSFPSRHGESGSTMVEFALVVMILMTMMLGAVEFGRALYAYHFVSHAARQAARWAAVNGSTCASDTSTSDTGGSCDGTDGMNSGYATAADIETYATNLAPTGINATDITATASWPASGTTPPTTSKCATYTTAPTCNCYSSTIGSDDTDGNSPGCTVEVTVSYDFKFIFPFVRTGGLTLSSTSESVITH